MSDNRETTETSGTPPRTLCAVLLNPALREQASTTTYRNTQAAARLINCDRLLIANLLNTPSKDAPELNRRIFQEAELTESRQELLNGLRMADEVLLGWGMGGMTGTVRLALRAQTRWLHETLRTRGFNHVWTVAGRPRHPSRWRQYVGPEKQRVEGSCFEDRLRKVLIPVTIGDSNGDALFDSAF